MATKHAGTTGKAGAVGSIGESSADRFPELRTSFDALQDEKADIAKRAAPLRAKRDAIGNQIRELAKQEEALRAQIEAIEHPRLVQLDAQLSRLASAMGGQRMSDGVAR